MFNIILFDIEIKFLSGHNCLFFQNHYFIIVEKIPIKKIQVFQLF